MRSLRAALPWLAAPGGDFSGASALLLAWAEAEPAADEAAAVLRAYEALGSRAGWLAADVEHQAVEAYARGRLLRAAGHGAQARPLLAQALALGERIDAPQSPWLARARAAADQMGRQAPAAAQIVR